MSKEQELLLIKEIKDIEQQLFEKQSKLTSVRYMDDNTDYGLDSAAWKKEFRSILSKMKKNSKGGNSVEDVKRKRR